MKKITVIILIMLFSLSAYAFDKGTKNVGCSFSFTSLKADYEAEAVEYFDFQGFLGYFAVKNLSIDFAANMVIQPTYNNYSYDRDFGSSTTTFRLGIGSRVFIHERLYFGYHLYQQFYARGDANITSSYLDFDAGIIAPVTENIYIDMGAQYNTGIGSYSGEDYGENNKNEESSFSIRAGLALYLKKK